MILFTLDINRKKIIIKYMIASVLCIIINYIYSKFGHGVTSNYMTYMFLYPLLIGLTVTLFNKKNSKLTSNLAVCGITTLTIGSFLQGVLEIAGATSPFIIVYFIIGVTLTISAFCGIILT